MKKFTFKTNKPTGKYRSFDVTYIDIKLNKLIVGGIYEPSYLSKETKVRIRFVIEDKTLKCGFKWVTLKASFDDLLEAKNYVIQRAQNIQKQFTLIGL